MELDIYFKEEYGKIYELNGEGELQQFRLENQYGTVIYNFLKREIPLESGKNYFDIATPYGYGGPLFLDYMDDESLNILKDQFKESFTEYCQRENIVSEFIRFHPILENHRFLTDYMEVSYNRDTICIEIENEEKILENFAANGRKNLKKAQAAGIRVEIGGNLEELYRLYIQTMERTNASDYYFFSKEFFRNTLDLLGDGAKIFSAYYDGKIIASLLVIHGGEFMHYHLIGSDYSFKEMGVNNMLIYQAARWGAANGKKYFHLGGGYSGNGDTLFRFKRTFSKGELCHFYIGKKIHNLEIYNKLAEERESRGKKEDTVYFPIYRG